MTISQNNNDVLGRLASQSAMLAGLQDTLSLDWLNGNLVLYRENIEIKRFSVPIKIGTVLNYIREYCSRPPVESLPDMIPMGPYHFDPRQSTLFPCPNNGDSIYLTDKERDVLVALWLAPDKSLSREGLLAAVWAYAEGVETHTLETHIYRLRQKIEENPAHPALLINTGGTYRLNI